MTMEAPIGSRGFAQPAVPAVLTMTRRERYRCRHTLVCLLHAVVGRITTVELRNECTATGHIENVDGFMNVTMTKVLFVDRDERKMHMESFFMQGSLIRYVQIPDDIDMVRAMKKEMLTLNPRRADQRKMRAPMRLTSK